MTASGWCFCFWLEFDLDSSVAEGCEEHVLERFVTIGAVSKLVIRQVVARIGVFPRGHELRFAAIIKKKKSMNVFEISKKKKRMELLLFVIKVETFGSFVFV